MEGVATNPKNVEAANAASVEQTAKAATRKMRRGISNETRATTRLKFNEKDANRSCSLFLGHLEEVKVDMVTIGAETTGLPSFTGLEVPRISFTFASNEADAASRKYYTHSFLAVESNAETIPGGKNAWQVDNPLRFIKHILDVFLLKGRAMTEAEEDALCLPFEDFVEENGRLVYEPVEAETVIAGWTQLFTNAANIINGVKPDAPAKPIYVNANGSYTQIWMKLLRFTKVKGEWKPVIGGKSTAGDLGMSSFIGSGVIELFKQTQAPNLTVDISKESITYKEVAKAPMAPSVPGAPTMPGMAMGGVGIDTPTYDGSETPDYSAAYGASAMDENPF